MKTIIFAILFFFLCFETAQAQSKLKTLAEKFIKKTEFSNSLRWSGNALYVKDRIRTIIPTWQIGYTYERRIVKNLYAGISYYQWRVWGNPDLLFFMWEPIAHPTPGILDSRIDYKMYDLYGKYNFRIPGTRHHSLSAGFGASYCKGINAYIREFYLNPWGNDATQYNDYLAADYWGVIPSFAYDYTFLRNRIVLGLETKVRVYSGSPVPPQYDYGVHFGINF